MTGAILRRLREACGYTRPQVGKMAAMSESALARLEQRGQSLPVYYPDRLRVRAVWHRYLAALRQLRDSGAEPGIRVARVKAGKAKSATPKLLQPVPVSEYANCPPGATHRVNHGGTLEWIRIASHAGAKRGFVLVAGEWVRSAWVEELVLGIPPRRRVSSGDGTVTELHYTGGRHG